jgi:hypothetical protein
MLSKVRREALGGASTIKRATTKVRGPDLAALIAKYDTAEAALRTAEDRSEELRTVHSVTFTDFDENPKGMPAPLRAARAAEKKLLASYSAARAAIVNYRPTSPTDAAALLQYAILNEDHPRALDLHNGDETRALVRNAIAAVRRVRPIRESANSEIIRQCVNYAQSLAANDAAFAVDATGDSEYAGTGNELRKAHRAMVRLNALSSAPDAAPLTAVELYAKAGVLKAMYGLRKNEELNEYERDFTGHFAQEVLRCLAARCDEVMS